MATAERAPRLWIPVPETLVLVVAGPFAGRTGFVVPDPRNTKPHKQVWVRFYDGLPAQPLDYRDLTPDDEGEECEGR